QLYKKLLLGTTLENESQDYIYYRNPTFLDQDSSTTTSSECESSHAVQHKLQPSFKFQDCALGNEMKVDLQSFMSELLTLKPHLCLVITPCSKYSDVTESKESVNVCGFMPSLLQVRCSNQVKPSSLLLVVVTEMFMFNSHVFQMPFQDN
ncbi:Protein Lines-1, partial [Galemys pyrenaicus]